MNDRQLSWNQHLQICNWNIAGADSSDKLRPDESRRSLDQEIQSPFNTPQYISCRDSMQPFQTLFILRAWIFWRATFRWSPALLLPNCASELSGPPPLLLRSPGSGVGHLTAYEMQIDYRLMATVVEQWLVCDWRAFAAEWRPVDSVIGWLIEFVGPPPSSFGDLKCARNELKFGYFTAWRLTSGDQPCKTWNKRNGEGAG